MKIPEPLFVIINPVMRILLRSPLHFIASESLLLMSYTGRRSGRRYTTPLRYVRDGDTIRCFTSKDTKWWRNLEDGAQVVLRIRGADAHYAATLVGNDPKTTRELLVNYLAEHPQDAAYHNVRLGSDKQPLAEDLEEAARNSIIMEAKPT